MRTGAISEQPGLRVKPDSVSERALGHSRTLINTPNSHYRKLHANYARFCPMLRLWEGWHTTRVESALRVQRAALLICAGVF